MRCVKATRASIAGSPLAPAPQSGPNPEISQADQLLYHVKTVLYFLHR
jgi:hypothetical protein